MNKIVIFTALFGLAAAAPGYYFNHDDSQDIYHSISSPSKTTITKTSQQVNHGGHEVLHVPIHHQPLHVISHDDSHDVYHSISSPSKTTITKTSQQVNHGGHEVLHVPVHHEHLHVISHEPVHLVHHEPVHTLVHTPVLEHKNLEPAKSSQYFKLENTVYKTPVVSKVVSTVPVVHQPVVHAAVYHAPIITRSGDSAVSHHSSYTHETEHEVSHLPLYTLHH